MLSDWIIFWWKHQQIGPLAGARLATGDAMSREMIRQCGFEARKLKQPKPKRRWTAAMKKMNRSRR